MKKRFLLLSICFSFLMTGCGGKETNISNTNNTKPIKQEIEVNLDDPNLDYTNRDVQEALELEMFKNLKYENLSETACDLTCEPKIDLISPINVDLEENLNTTIDELEFTVLGRDITITGTTVKDFTNSLKGTYAIARNFNGEHLIPPYTSVALLFSYDDNEEAFYYGNSLLVGIYALNYSPEYVPLNDLVIYSASVSAKDLSKWGCSSNLPLETDVYERSGDFLIEANNKVSTYDNTQNIMVRVTPRESLEIHNYIKTLGTNLSPIEVPKKFEDNDIFFKDTLYKLKETTAADVYNNFELDEEDLPNVLAEYIIGCESNFFLAGGTINFNIPLSILHDIRVYKSNSLNLTEEILTFEDLYTTGINSLTFEIEDDNILLKTKYIDSSNKFKDIYKSLEKTNKKEPFLELKEDGLEEGGKISFSYGDIKNRLSCNVYANGYIIDGEDVKTAKVEFNWYD